MSDVIVMNHLILLGNIARSLEVLKLGNIARILEVSKKIGA